MVVVLLVLLIPVSHLPKKESTAAALHEHRTSTATTPALIVTTEGTPMTNSYASAPRARNAYLAATITTASPQQLLIMLCDRLALDVERAADALRNGNPSQAHQPMLHAQEIVAELSSTLNVDLWEGARGLASLYDYLHHELVRANIAKDLVGTEFCLGLITTLRDTWREAAGSLLAETA